MFHSPSSRRSRHGRRPRHRKVYGCSSPQSYIDYKMESSGPEGKRKFENKF